MTSLSLPGDDSCLSQLHEHGFVVIRSVLTESEVHRLQYACDKAITQARAGRWPYIRTVPRQFPPWPLVPSEEGIWGVQHLMHPCQPGRDIFVQSYFNQKIIRVVEQILGITRTPTDSSGHESPRQDRDHLEENPREPEPELLTLELYNLLVRPDRDFELRWHRDDIPPTATSDEELSALGMISLDGAAQPKAATYSHTQWNLPLYSDHSLIVVPGTHRRARTEAERIAGPYDILEGQLVVKLEPGDAVFYDNDILHRGIYDSSRERATLHGSIGKRGYAEKRARNVLQHGVGGWIEKASFEVLGDRTAARIRAEAMRKNLLDMGRGRAVVYSQQD